MISWLFIHHNRPFFLKLCIDLLRSFGNKNWQIVVADCGSCNEVRNKIKFFSVDDVIFCDNNYPLAIMKGIKSCNRDFFVFSEDDLPYVSQPLQSWQIHTNHPRFEIFPKIYFNNCKPEWGYSSAVEILKQNSGIKYIKMSLKKGKRQKRSCSDEPQFDLLHVANNWPYLMRMDDAKRIHYPDSCFTCDHVEQYERKKFGEWNESCYKITTPVHTHVGSWLTVNDPINKFQWYEDYRSFFVANYYRLKFDPSDDTRGSYDVDQNILRGRGLKNKLLDLWLKGKFYIDIDQIISLGFSSGMRRAFSRIKGL